MEDLIKSIYNIHENIQRLEAKNKSLDVIERIRDKYPDKVLLECEYQNYCQKFSNAYLILSPFYVGDSFVEYMINKKGNIDYLFGGLFCTFLLFTKTH